MRRTFALFSIALLLASAARAGDWPQWRGPEFNGSAPESGLPDRFGPSENILWSAPLPGEGGSTPAIVGGRVYLASTDRDGTILYALAIDAASGRELWRKSVSERGKAAEVPYNRDASPSPVADASRAVFLFGSGDLLAFAPDGAELWKRNLCADHGPFTHLHRYAASPLLHAGRVYIAVLRDTSTKNLTGKASPEEEAGPLESYVLCVDPATGKDLWKVARPSSAKGIESRESYATPLAVQGASGPEIVVVGADYATAHDEASGAEQWRFFYARDRGFRRRVVPSPVLAGGFIVCSKPRYGALFALRPGGAGELSASSVAWETEEGTPDVPTPLLLDGRLYFIHDSEKTISCLDPKSGKALWTGRLGGKAIYHASPTGADGKVYCVNLAGEATVVAAGDSFKILSRASMGGEPCMSSIAIADGSLFFRAEDRLCRISKKP